MSSLKKIVILGGGGHAKVLVDLIKMLGSYDAVGVLDSRLKKGDVLLGVPVLGNDQLLKGLYAKGFRELCLGVGMVGLGDIRRKLYLKAKAIGFNLPPLVHPSAVVSRYASLAQGAQVMANAVIQPGSFIGESTIINTSAVVDHDCKIGRFVHICPNATVSGGCVIGDDSFIGAGATLIHGINVCANVLIGAKAAILKDINKKGTYVGCPVRRVK